MRIVKAVQTSWACPSQWDAWTDEGQYLYLRYRNGYGYARADEYWSNVPGEVIESFSYGHPLDGVIELEQFCELAGIELDLE